MTRHLFAAAFCAACVFAGTAAWAHAFLDHAVPAVGGTVARPPAEVTLWFTQPLEPAFSSVAVTNVAGQRVDTGKTTIDPKDPHELHVPLKPLTPGDYKVRWHVVSVDTHRTEGDFSFTVGR
ncbi:MAG: copper homeostasis periplasmic binding protein CopC [Stellaceae bacterium]